VDGFYSFFSDSPVRAGRGTGKGCGRCTKRMSSSLPAEKQALKQSVAVAVLANYIRQPDRLVGPGYASPYSTWWTLQSPSW